MTIDLLEGRLGQQLLGKKREPLDVATMQQAARSTALARGRTAAKKSQEKEQAKKAAIAKSPTVSAVSQPAKPAKPSTRGPSTIAHAVRAARAGMGSTGPIIKGTPFYMSPEQARGEHDEPVNPAVPSVRGKGPYAAHKQASILAKHVGVSAVVCKDAQGKTYTSTKGCGAGHSQVGSRVHPSQRRPAVQQPAMPAPSRTQAARQGAKRWGVYPAGRTTAGRTTAGRT